MLTFSMDLILTLTGRMLFYSGLQQLCVQGDAKGAQIIVLFLILAGMLFGKSKVSIKKDGGWLKLKFLSSALVFFLKREIQDWGINFARFCRTDNENSIWNPEDPNINGDINQWVPEGFQNIKPPLRLLFPSICQVRISPRQTEM